MLRRNKILFALFIYSLGSFSQLQVKNFFSLTGRRDVPVNVMTQDLSGFIWLGTQNGLYRFDGKTTKEFSKEKPVLKKNITALFVDEKDRLWIGTKFGKVYFIAHDKVDSLNFGDKPNEENITSFCEIREGLCIGTYGNGFYTWNDNTLKHIDSQNGLSDNVIYKITSNRAADIWCGTDAGITEIKNVFTKPVFNVISDDNGLPDNIVRDITFEDNRLLIAMQDSGVCFYNLTARKIQRLDFFTNWTLGTVINAYSINTNKMVIATEQNGLLQIDKGALFVYNYQQLLMTPSISQLFIDREKQIWVTSSKGISQFTERRYNFVNASKGLSDYKILALSVDNDNALWVGTAKGISRIMNDDEGKVVVNKIKDMDRYTVSCATKAPDGNIWFGTYGSGIVVLNSMGKNSIILNSQKKGLSNDNISNIYFSDNDVYISTLGGGLIKGKINPDKGNNYFSVEKTYTEAEGLGSDYVYQAITDSEKRLYVATDGGGLQKLENGKFTDLTKKFNLASNTVFSLCKDKYNTIWAASNSDGILKYDGKTIESISTLAGLRDEQPQQLVSNDNTVYAINSKGIDKIDCKTNAITYYDVFDGDLEPNLNAVCFFNGKIFSGTNNGVLVYRTNTEMLDAIKPRVVITGFELNYKPFPMDSIVEFKHHQNNMAFGFDGIWLKNPNKLTFRYRLHGFEDEWQYSDEGKEVNYNNLNPGNYTFGVQVKNEEDVWSDPTSYSFVILTPIWKRWWFWILMIAAAAAAMYAFITYRLKSLQKENLLLERRVRERTYQIEQQSKIIESKNIELEQLSLVASKTDNVVLILDQDGRLEYINESFEKLNKMSIDEVKRKYGETIFELSNNPNIREIVNEAVTNRRSVNYESLNKKIETGAEVWESSTLTPIFDESGKLKKIIIIDTDVSIRKKQEQIITQKNKDITDSIYYAKKIQHAILPEIKLIKNHLPQSFILYMTKDIVSGDFYWFTHLNGCSIIAAVDCTGHGVPGAFMSLIGYNLLNRIVNEEKITDPKNILLELNNGVLGVLHKNESESKDGMDIAICKINHGDHTLQYAGAMRPLWIVSNNGETEIREIKADKIPIGTRQKDREETIAFNTHTIPLKKGETFYIFTDGYADQFGGEKDKKYSTSRFKQLLQTACKKTFDEQEEFIRQEHHNWKGNNEQVDDILVIGFTV